jgi:hypothetical protein
VRLLVVTLGLALTSLALAQERAPVEQEAPACVTVRGEPRFQGYGQTHVVIVKNACDRHVRCEVYTDVDPSPRYTLVVAPGETEEIATRQGSPSSAFKPGYRCEHE